MKATTKNRGEFRQLVAQMIMLCEAHRISGGERLCDINRESIDAYYYKHLDFNPTGIEIKRFREVLDLLTQLLGDSKRPKVIKHEAIHLVLLVDTLLDDYTRGWTEGFANAFDGFKQALAIATKTRFADPPPELWTNPNASELS